MALSRELNMLWNSALVCQLRGEHITLIPVTEKVFACSTTKRLPPGIYKQIIWQTKSSSSIWMYIRVMERQKYFPAILLSLLFLCTELKIIHLKRSNPI